MVDWKLDEQGHVQIEKVGLTDLDISLKLKGDKLLRIPTMHPHHAETGKFHVA